MLHYNLSNAKNVVKLLFMDLSSDLTGSKCSTAQPNYCLTEILFSYLHYCLKMLKLKLFLLCYNFRCALFSIFINLFIRKKSLLTLGPVLNFTNRSKCFMVVGRDRVYCGSIVQVQPHWDWH